jgi:ribosomal protein S12 methylthiotransferase accessory factor
VDAHYKGFVIHTDQPADGGGAGSAPSPFDLFLASLGTCAGFFVLSFCQTRKIPTDGITLALTAVRDEAKHRVAAVEIEILLPKDMPSELADACVRAAGQCSVARHLVDAPTITVRAKRGSSPDSDAGAAAAGVV